MGKLGFALRMAVGIYSQPCKKPRDQRDSIPLRPARANPPGHRCLAQAGTTKTAKPAIAPRGAPTGRLRLKNRNRGTGFRQMQCRRHAGEAATDDRHIHLVVAA